MQIIQAIANQTNLWLNVSRTVVFSATSVQVLNLTLMLIFFEFILCLPATAIYVQCEETFPSTRKVFVATLSISK